jgi:hypothetical protein
MNMPPSSRATAGAEGREAFSTDDRAANVRDARNILVVDDFIPTSLVADRPTPDDYIVEPAVAMA